MKHTVRSSLVLAAALCLAAAAAGSAAHACLNADHRHRVLLGVASAGPVFLELDLHRNYDEDDKGVVLTWTGEVSLRTPAGKDPIQRLPAFETSRRIEVGRSRLTPARVLAGFRDAFDRAVADARTQAARLDGFVPAPTPMLELCGSGRRCGLRIERQPGGPPMLVADAAPAPVRVPIDLPTRFLQEATDNDTLDDFLAELKPHRVLSYRTTAGTVLVVDIGVRAGEPSGGPDAGFDEPADRAWPPCLPKHASPFAAAAPTLQHGAQVEVVVPLGAARRRAPAAPAPVGRCGKAGTALPSQSRR